MSLSLAVTPTIKYSELPKRSCNFSKATRLGSPGKNHISFELLCLKGLETIIAIAVKIIKKVANKTLILLLTIAVAYFELKFSIDNP